MNNKILNRLIIQGRRLLAAAGIGLAMVLLTTAAQAQIGILNGSPLVAPASLGGGPTVNKAFTVTTGASVLVVILEDRQNATILAEPTTITWNGTNVLTQDTNSLANTSNFRSMAMYHLYNPPVGSGNITATYSAGNNTILMTAYTLAGVNTNVAPIILQTNSAGTASSFFGTTTGVAAGSWAAVGCIVGTTGGTLTTTGTGGTATTAVNNNVGGSEVNAGYVANLSAGTVAVGVTPSTGNKGCFIADIFTPAPPSPPIIANQPKSQTIFTNQNVQFTVSSAGASPFSYYWFTQGTTPPLSNGGNLTGATSNVLTIANATLANAANYFVIVSNVYGTATSSVANLSLTVPSGAYQAAVIADNPFAYYSFSETADPSTNGLVAQDSTGNFDGTYGVASQNGFDGIVGPQTTADGLVGFPNGNTALGLNGTPASAVTLPAFNLNNGVGTNVLTITAWIYPNGQQANAAGIVFCRGGSTVAGVAYLDNNPNNYLGYNWANDANNYNWNSGLVPPANVWSLVALVVTSTNATLYICNTNNGLLSATHVYPHVIQKFDAPTLVGYESYATTRVFNGSIDEVGMFNQALTQSQVAALFSAASGIKAFPPAIGVNPTWASPTVFVGQTDSINVIPTGTAPLSYQWLAGPVGSGMYTNLVNGGDITGATSSTLTITNAQLTDSLDYVVEISNAYGSVTSAVPATLTVTPVGPPINFTLNYNGTPIQEGIGADWNNANVWNPGGLSASNSVIGNPGSTFEVVVGSRLRNPTATTNNFFPGTQLIVDGDGIFENGTLNNVGEIRFKNVAASALLTGGFVTTNYFPDLVLNGGQLNIGDNTTVNIQGQVTVTNNSILYAGGTGATNQSFQIDAFLTGSGTLEYFGLNTTNKTDLVNSVVDITGNTNTFTGTWDIEQGPLVGNGVNSLGTNTITIDTNGTLETSYPINNTNASLVLNGKVNLTQSDVFKSVYINGVGLAPGTYSAATLSASYPSNFPATFAALYGTTATTVTGQITVLTGGTPIVGANPVWNPATLYVGQASSISVSASGTPPYSYQWLAGAVGSGVYTALPNSGGISGANTATLTITNAQLTNYLDYVVRISNVYGAVTSTVPATLTINDSSPFLVTDIAPNPATYYAGATVILTATFAGSLPIAYQWVTDGGSGTFTNIPGATSSTLVITNVQAGNAGNYYLTAANLAGGPASSGQTTLTVVPATYEIYFGATNAITTADAVLNQPGVVTGAAVFGGTAEVVTLSNGSNITFTADGSVASVSPGNTGGNFAYPAPNTTGNPTFDAVLNQCTFDLGPETIYLNNLVAGHKYSVLLIGLDDRGLPANGGAPARFAYFQDPVAPTDVSSTFQMGDSVYVKAAFLAQTTTQTIIEQLPTSGDGNMNALVVYDVSTVVTPPSSPHITAIQVSGTALTLSATNGTPGGSWTLLQSTNLALPLNQWQTNTTGAFDGSGNLSTTIPNTATNKQEFYLLEVH